MNTDTATIHTEREGTLFYAVRPSKFCFRCKKTAQFCFTTDDDPSWFQHYIDDPNICRDHIIDCLNVSRISLVVKERMIESLDKFLLENPV